MEFIKENIMSTEIEKIDKIYKCLVSCETAEQFNSAFSMLFRYNNVKNFENERVVLFMSQVESYALDKRKEFLI